MPIPPALRRLNISFVDSRIDVEEGGVYRITKRSLTGMGTLTRWIYPEDLERRRGEGRDELEAASAEARRDLPIARSQSFDSCIDGTLSTISSRESTPEIGLEQDNGCFNGYDMDVDAYSDTTEIVDEEAEKDMSRRIDMLRDVEPLPDLPYERIMMKISREPTVILDDTFRTRA